MGYYSVVLHGQGILFPIEGGKPATGFFTTRAVKAKSADEAVLKARRLVEALWAGPDFASHNKGSPPQFTTEEVKELSFWKWRKIPNKGHVFYE